MGTRSGKVLALLAFAAAIACAPELRASQLNLPADATDGLQLLYNGQPDRALPLFQKIEQEQPESPLGYLLEAEAQWWRMYCEACEIRWGFLDAWKEPNVSQGNAYLALLDKTTQLAETSIAKKDTAEMELYAGMSDLLRARLLGLRDDRKGTARAGVKARAHLLRCLQLNPQMADAYAGLGLYNYYVDTLSTMARVLRFFMGIPGGNKQTGIQQLRTAMEQGELTQVEARFYLAKNLRSYDFQYAQATDVLAPLVRKYPDNPVFLLLMGNLDAKLARNEAAAVYFREVEEKTSADAGCAERASELAREFLEEILPQGGR
ncbi:MAG: tetratricopeptide repeat protein [Candidatus Acidiferrales bacterium]